MSPLKSWGCSICGAQCPKKYRAHGKFADRMAWLRKHRKAKHPTAYKQSVAKSLKTKAL